MKHLPVTEADLHAYVDGLLPADRAVEVAAYLTARPAEQTRLKTYRAQNTALRAMFNPVLEEPVPLALLNLPRAARAAPIDQPHAWRWQSLAASLAIALVSGSTGWLLHGAATPNLELAQLERPAKAGLGKASGLAHQAAIAHVVYSPDLRRPVEIGADQEDQLVGWLSKRMGNQIRPPKLGKLGYELIGGRLLPGESGPVAQFMYHDSTGQRLTLYVSTEQVHNQDTGFKFSQEGPVQVFYWIDGKFGYALSGGINKAELGKIASAVYAQLAP
ncbi:anti-sigma factor family protein [Undibacterium parvum]|uniref:Anti-sigma factor n=1 Tax=Undibacterium parvum TaxID=401471 RepID=A0A3S9HJC0_9BURK|nr:anti-sigma factor [Undibacterium parvum]AZP12201.1 anti-sigma factor [Undibacterium parvum]